MTDRHNPIELRLLGTPRCELPGHGPLVFDGRKSLALLAWLVLHPDVPQPRERLAALLWPDLPDTRARSNLRVALSRLNRTFGGTDPPCLRVERESLAHDPAAPLWIDALALERSRDAMRSHRTPEPGDGSIATLERAASLHAGAFLDGFRLDGCDEFEEWQHETRERLRRSAVELDASLAERYLNDGTLDKSERCTRHELALDPLRESAHRRLMRLLSLRGDRNGALAHYRKVHERLQAELGTEPDGETTDLHDRIERGDPALVATDPVAATTAPAAHNLPHEKSAYIGQEGVCERLVEHLRTERLITLTGIGGIGKSRLALEIARRSLARFPDGVHLVRLGALHDAGSVPTAIADAVDFRFAPGGDIVAQLLAHLDSRRVLLILDNFEHLLDGRALVAAILERSATVHLLVTSRQRLELQGEAVYPVPGLEAAPAPRHGTEIEAHTHRLPSAAARLFLDVAHRVRLDFTPRGDDLRQIERIGRLVDGHPLALVLAAGWLASLSCREIADELAADIELLATEALDVPERQRSISAAFENSWRLLEESERATLAALSVFRGGFERGAAVAVAGASLRGLGRLVAKSLIHHDVEHGRYGMHELLRQFADMRLHERGEAEEVGRRHAGHYAELLLALGAEGSDERPRQDALERLERDMANVRTAWRHGVDRADIGYLAALVTPLRTVCALTGREHDLVNMLEPVLPLASRVSASGNPSEGTSEAPSPPGSAAFELDLLLALGVAYRSTRGYSDPALSTVFERAQTLVGDIEDSPELFAVLYGLWSFNFVNGRLDRALDMVGEWRRRLDTARVLGDASDYLEDARFIVYCLEGPVHHLRGDLVQAGELLERGLALDREARRDAIVAVYGLNFAVSGRYWIASNYCLRGRLDRGLAHMEAARAIARASGQPLARSFAAAGMAVVSTHRRDARAAREHAAEVRTLLAEHGIAAIAHMQSQLLAGFALVESDVERGIERMREEIDGTPAMAICRDLHACLFAAALLRAGRPDEASERLISAAALAVTRDLGNCFAEILRLDGEVSRLRGDVPAAAERFERALAVARRQGALLFELRAATSLARLHAGSDRARQAGSRLDEVIGRFSEGLDTPDLVEAREMLVGIADGGAATPPSTPRAHP